jgi:hypothetical protein
MLSDPGGRVPRPRPGVGAGGGGRGRRCQLEQLYRVKAQGPDTKLFGIISIPLSHSKSPFVYNSAFLQLNETASHSQLGCVSKGGGQGKGRGCVCVRGCLGEEGGAATAAV